MTHAVAFTSKEIAYAYSAVGKVLVHPEDRRDAVQTALLHAWEHRGDYDGQVRFTTWLYQVATNAAIDILRARGRRLGMLAALYHEAPRTAPGPHGEVEARDLARAVAAVMAGAPPEQAEALKLRHVDGLRDDAIARVQGVPVNTVKTRMRYARARMAKAAK